MNKINILKKFCAFYTAKLLNKKSWLHAKTPFFVDFILLISWISIV